LSARASYTNLWIHSSYLNHLGHHGRQQQVTNAAARGYLRLREQLEPLPLPVAPQVILTIRE
jgi:hypothetical protein